VQCVFCGAAHKRPPWKGGCHFALQNDWGILAVRRGMQLPMSPTARFLLYAQKKPGKENGSRGGFSPDALPLHPYLLTLRSVRPHIWAGCTRPPPLPEARLWHCCTGCKRPPWKGGWHFALQNDWGILAVRSSWRCISHRNCRRIPPPRLRRATSLYKGGFGTVHVRPCRRVGNVIKYSKVPRGGARP